MIRKTISACILFGVCCAPLAVLAQQGDHHDDHAQQQNDRRDGYNQQHQGDRHDDRGQQQQYVEHREWKRGYHMNHGDWNRGQQVNYRAYHLQRPRSGYEWRQLDGNYIMANSRTGVVSVVIARH